MNLVLKPYWIAEECFLREALLWAGFYRFPKSEILPDMPDFRFDKNRQDEYEPMIMDDYGYIESEEAVRVGLPPNPEWEAILDGTISYPFDPETLDMFLKMDISEEEKEKFRNDHKRAEEQAEAQADWDTKYEEYIEAIQAKLFLALKEGTLESWGKVVSVGENGAYSTPLEHDKIPANFWRLNEIDWGSSASETEKGHYCHIYVNTEQLFALFPPPEAEVTKGVSLIAGQYMLDEEYSPKHPKITQRGRPAMNWDSFHLQVSTRLLNGGLPEKQESFISEMGQWCLQNWGIEPGRSTLLQKISPYYKVHVRK